MGTLSFFTLFLLLTSYGKASKPEEVAETPKGYDSSEGRKPIDELKNMLTASDSMFSARKIAKRSANDNRPRADDFILKSIASYCESFSSDPAISEYLVDKFPKEIPLSQQDMTARSENIPQDSKRSGTWDTGASLLKISTQRESDKTWIVFEIAHSETVKVTRLDYSDLQEVVLKVPESECYKSAVSKARFGFHPSQCSSSYPGSLKLEHFRIKLATSVHALNVYIDMCLLLPRRRLQKVENDIVVSLFKLLPLSDERQKMAVTISDSSKYTTFYVDVFWAQYTIMKVDLVLWDTVSKEVFQSNAQLKIDTYGIPSRLPVVTYGNLPSAHDGFDEGLINVTAMPHPGGEGYEDTPYSRHMAWLRLRIDVRSTPGQNNVVGQISVTQEPRHDGYTSRNVVYALEATVPLVRIGQQWSFPHDLIYFQGSAIFRCNLMGNIITKYKPAGQNCVIQCHARGVDLSIIYITKRTPSPKAEDFKLESYVTSDMAGALLHVGPSSDDIKGDYDCTVVNKRGYAKTRKLEMLLR